LDATSTSSISKSSREESGRIIYLKLTSKPKTQKTQNEIPEDPTFRSLNVLNFIFIMCGSAFFSEISIPSFNTN
jgi:hypothetical protein